MWTSLALSLSPETPQRDKKKILNCSFILHLKKRLESCDMHSKLIITLIKSHSLFAAAALQLLLQFVAD